MAANTEPSTRATVFSLCGQADAAGQIAGGPPIGLIGERASVRAALVATGVLFAPAVALTAAAVRRERPVRDGVLVPGGRPSH
jgi:DHA3 family tetracycline resistance protein-like MFS transporter